MNIPLLKTKPSHYVILQTAFFTLAFLFYETVLARSCLSTAFPSVFAAVFSAVCGSVISTATLLFRKNKTRKNVGITLLVLTGLIFSLETSLYRSFGYFYSPETVLDMGTDVLGSYSGTVFQTFLSMIPIILIYQIPTAIYILLSKKTYYNKGEFNFDVNPKVYTKDKT